jgi:hypothetical protein
MFLRLLPALALGSVCLVGCQAPDLTDDVSAYVVQTNDVRAKLCDCILDLGNPDAECDASLDQLTQVNADCMVSALDGHEREGQDYLDCVNAALYDYVQCVTLNSACDDATNDSCTSAYATAAGACSQLPTDVRASFEACGG